MREIRDSHPLPLRYHRFHWLCFGDFWAVLGRESMNNKPSDQAEHGPLATHIDTELLVAGFDLSLIEMCREAASPLAMVVRAVENAETMFEVLESGFVDVLLLNEAFPENQDCELLRHVRYWYPETRVIVVSSDPRYSSAAQAIKLGAFDYLPAPLDRETLQSTIVRAMEQRQKHGGQESPGKDLGIVGESLAIEKLSKLIRKLAFNVQPVLILGESGTGKELVARAIHFHGSRRE